MRKLLKKIFWLAFGLESLLFIVFGLPILGVMSAFELAERLGCTLNASDVHVCMLMGVDIGERLYGYTVPLLGLILTPVAFVLSFLDILIVINLICLGCWISCRFITQEDENFAA